MSGLGDEGEGGVEEDEDERSANDSEEGRDGEDTINSCLFPFRAAVVAAIMCMFVSIPKSKFESAEAPPTRVDVGTGDGDSDDEVEALDGPK
ncbi:hypothetical protein BGZ58_007356 [Dissophora ornata]|nr:hypothetical protein BGZ58_007356 [Dissophora ornata]